MSGIRITAGQFRGRKVPFELDGVRPTSSRAREAFFNIVAREIPGARFLDLYAGSGIMSLEAISRGAAEAVAVDLSGRALSALAAVARSWEIAVTTRREDVIRFLSSPSSPFDVVYADPPYDFDHHDQLVTALDARAALTPGAVVAVEHRKKRPLGDVELSRLTHRETRSWGQVTIDLFDLHPP